MPAAVHAAWTEGQDDWACITFGVRVNASTGPDIANLTSCHRPSRLPSAQKPNNITLCYCEAPYINPLVPGANGFYSMAQNMLYHLRHGVNQVIVYLNLKNRDLAFRMLAPFVSRGVCSVVLVDTQYNYHERNQNDCLNRLKGRTKLYRDIDFDEFLFASRWYGDPRWHVGASLADELQPLIDSDSYMALPLRSYHWVKPLDTLHHLLTDTQYHLNFQEQKKVLSKPDYVAHDWIHQIHRCYKNSTHFSERCSPFPAYTHRRT
ncbi:unnamed protein product [Prorocentrum cordatum]|uniref:Nucleotide-diphospho-sugar transferase domain-containing protein n=1 Tax=Prorocentrum cordatum TaxID=2364126 RepID=A0ABN9PMC4_9DINO|nr:unnamed protein product [Polarella glacialis]